MPIAIRLDGGTPDLDRLSEVVADNAAGQLGRAFELLDERGPWQPRIGTFSFAYTGAAARLSPAERRVLEAKVGDGLGRGARYARVGKTGGGGGGGGGGHGAPPKKKRKGRGKGKQDAIPAARRLKPVNAWVRFSDTRGEEFDQAFLSAKLLWMLDNNDRELPDTFALLYRLSGEAEMQLWVIVDGKTACRTSLSVVEWTTSDDGKTASSKIKPAEIDADSAHMSLTRVDDGHHRWRDNAIDNVVEKMVKAQKLEGSVSREGAAERASRLRSAAAAVVDARMTGWDAAIGVYYKLSGGGLYPFAKTQFPEPHPDHIDVLALTEVTYAGISDEDLDAVAGVGGDLPDASDDGGGGGKADKGLGLGSDVTAPEGQDVGKGYRGIVIDASYRKPGGSIYPILPPDPRATGVKLACEPYEGEPDVDDPVYGGGGPRMKALITEIAARLEMDVCPYPSHFCITSLRMIRMRTSQVHQRFVIDAERGDFTAELSVGTRDDRGRFVFRALDSQAVQYLQHLAGTVPKVRELMEMVRVYVYPLDKYRPHHWFAKVAEEGFQAAGLIWLVSNQFMMAQLLDASRRGVLERQNNPRYAELFESVVRSQLANQIESVLLRTALEEFESVVGDRKGLDAYSHFREQKRLQSILAGVASRRFDEAVTRMIQDLGHGQDLATRLTQHADYVFKRGQAADIADVGAIVETEQGPWAIRGSDNKLYSKAQLDELIALRQQTVTAMDPLISQLLHRLVSDVRPLVDEPGRIPKFLDKLLADMLSKNREVSGKNRSDYEYAFEHGQIHRVDRNTPPAVQIRQIHVWGWNLQGIHALAHTHVGHRFEGDAFYNAAVDKLLGQEYYWREFVEDMVFVFGIAFTVICPPLGAALSFVANLALGVEAYYTAKEKEKIHGALFNPEDVINYAELQIELFMAKLQIGLSFLELVPGAGKALKGLTGLGKKAAKEGAKRGLRKMAREVVMEELEKLSRLTLEDFVEALAREIAEEVIEDKIVDALVSPIIEGHIKQLEKELHDEGLL